MSKVQGLRAKRLGKKDAVLDGDVALWRGQEGRIFVRWQMAGMRSQAGGYSETRHLVSCRIRAEVEGWIWNAVVSGR